jgi:hypothetical protein
MTLTWHDVGAVRVLWQDDPETLNGAVAVAALNVTDPLPVILTVTVWGELTAGDVPVGMPNVR